MGDTAGFTADGIAGGGGIAPVGCPAAGIDAAFVAEGNNVAAAITAVAAELGSAFGFFWYFFLGPSLPFFPVPPPPLSAAAVSS